MSLSFKYEDYYRACTRFFSKFDHNFSSNVVKTKDTKLRKRKYKLYRGFRKEELIAYTDK